MWQDMILYMSAGMFWGTLTWLLFESNEPDPIWGCAADFDDDYYWKCDAANNN